MIMNDGGRRERNLADAVLLDHIARDEGSSKAAMVELVRLYSNPRAALETLPIS